MEAVRTCAKCGTTISPYAPAGLCAECLLRDGFSGSAEETLGTAPEAPLEAPAASSSAEGNARFFGDYELLEPIAQGGMGIVYRARHLKLGRVVALKMLLLGPQASPESVKRFQVEVVAAASLQHPNIVAIHEVGFREGQHFFTMDFVNGPTLAALAQGKPLAAQRAARYVQAIAEAIHYAHGRGILHRDLKPSNVLIDEVDQPRVTDFGLAKRFVVPPSGGLGSEPAEAGTTNDLTLTGQVLGTPNYLPPEQAGGRRQRVSRASDVYALGAMLYFLLTGRPPFVGETLETTLAQVLHQEPVSLRLLNGSVPRDLETICLKCLEKEPSGRYATAQLLADDLGRFLRCEPIVARPVGPVGKLWRWCRRKPVVAGLSVGVVAALIMGFLGVAWQWRQTEQRRRQAERQRQLQRRFAYVANMRAADLALLQNDRGLVASFLKVQRPMPGELDDLRGIEWRYLWQQIRTDEARSFPHPKSVKDALMSPAGEYLVTACNDDKVRVWDLVSGRAIREFESLHFLSDRKCFAFAPDGEWVVLPGPRAAIEIRETSGWSVRNRLVSSQPPLCLSGDGQLVVADGGDLGGEGQTLVAWDVREGSEKRLTTAGVRYGNLAIALDGARIACSTANPFWDVAGDILCWDLHSGRIETIATNEQTLCLAISPDGTCLASAHISGEICFWNMTNGQPIRRFAAHLGPVYACTFSPGGTLLANGGTDQLIHIWETGTSNRVGTFQGHRGGIHSCAFSSDGQWLISAAGDATAKLWRVQPPRAKSQTFVLPTNTLPVGPLPDGSALVAVDESAKTTHLWSLSDGHLISSNGWRHAEDRGCRQVRFFAASRSAVGVSSDGTVHLWDLTTGAHVRSVALGGTNFWPIGLSPDRRWLLGGTIADLISSAGQHNTVWDLETARPVLRLHFPELSVFCFGFSPDSRWFAYTDRNNVVRIRDLAANREKASLTVKGQADMLLALRFSPDGRLLAIGGVEEVSLWSLDTGEALPGPVMKRAAIRLSFSADGKTLAGSGLDSVWL
jgi:serine/threonine protein kinase/WD40 repeat protein